MKILAIRGRNLASLEGDFELDFRQEPLLSAGIFAISGPTGSGKSTLLDAMCLALFARTPRTSQAKENSIRLADVNEEQLAQGDPRFMLRRGTASGFAEVDFVALNGASYRARWSVSRARNKATGRLQNPAISLTNCTNGTEESGSRTDLQNRIVELIGLTFDQFTRAVLLAQNDFSTFLKAEQSEKAALLEKLTGTEIYSQISRKIFERNSAAKAAYDAIRMQLDQIALLSEEEETALEAEFKTVDARLHRLQQAASEKQQLDQQQQHTEKQQLEKQNSLTLKRGQEKTAGEALDTARKAFDALQQKQQAFEASVREMQPVMQQARKLDIESQAAVREAKTAAATAKAALQKLNENEALGRQEAAALQQLRDQQQQLTQWFEKYKEKAAIAAQYTALSLHLDQADQAVRNLDNCRKELDELTKTAGKLADEQLRIRAEIEKESTALNESAAQFNALDIKLKQQNQEAVQTKMDQLREERERLLLAFAENVIKLRSQLKAGLPCPVCGSLAHPFADADTMPQEDEIREIDRLLADLLKQQEQYKADTQRLMQLQQHIMKLQQQLAVQNNNLEKSAGMQQLNRSKTEAAKAVIAQQQQQLGEALAATDLLFGNSDWQKNWQQNPAAFRQSLQQFAAGWQQKTEALRTLQPQIDALQGKTESLQRYLPQFRQEAQQAQEAADKKQAVATQLAAERQQLLGGRAVEKLEEEQGRQQEQFRKELLSLQETQSRQTAEAAALQGVCAQLVQDLEQLAVTYKQDLEQLAGWQEKYAILLAGPSADPQNAAAGSEKSALGQDNSSGFDLTSTAAGTNQTTFGQEADFSIDQQPETAGALNLDLSARMSELLEQQLAAIGTLQADLQYKLKKQTEHKQQAAAFRTELTRKQEDSERWAKLNDLAGSADGGKFRRIAQGYTLDVLLSYANVQLRDLTRRYGLERVPDTLALQVIDHDMCDEIRSVHSLSGGESFLVSLALALGLSSLSSNRMKVESLFIDEGFGSLDADTLRIAMDALENLRTQGRKIGVISHVQEMTERIPVQIRVMRSGNGRSTLEITG